MLPHVFGVQQRIAGYDSNLKFGLHLQKDALQTAGTQWRTMHEFIATNEWDNAGHLIQEIRCSSCLILYRWFIPYELWAVYNSLGQRRAHVGHRGVVHKNESIYLVAWVPYRTYQQLVCRPFGRKIMVHPGVPNTSGVTVYLPS